jgi:hypothetical protein
MQLPGVVWHVWPCLLLQAPVASQVPGQLSMSSWFLTGTHVPPGPEQVVHVPVQSLALQQVFVGMQAAVPQGL